MKGGHEGCSYILNANYKVFVIKWRDVPPRPPWTRQVWDIYQVLPNSCGACETLRHLGWQWCWGDVIKTIRSEVFRHWINAWSGAGGITVLTGQTIIADAQVIVPQIGPVLWLDGADPDSFELSGGEVIRWLDKSGRLAHAFSEIGSRPAFVTNVLDGKSVVDFTPGQFLQTPTKAQNDTHIFALMRYRGGGDPIGTVYAATGYEGSFGGPDLKVIQSGMTQGSLASFVDPQLKIFSFTSVPVNGFAVIELTETIALQGILRMGINGVLQTVFSGNTSMDGWNPMAQTFGQPVPLKASLGRSNWGINPMRTFDYLDGQIAELLVYPLVLGEGQRIQVHNALRSKWNLGPPLVLS